MALFLPAAELQLARGESYRDTALVLSRFVSALMIRTFEQDEVDEFAEHASIPVINGLTDRAHPLQALADAMTLRERFGSLEGVRIAYVGDGNNVCHSLMRIAARFGMHFVAATPSGYEPDADIVAASTDGRGGRRRKRATHERRTRGCLGRPGRLHRRLDEHGPGSGLRGARARSRAVPHRRRSARVADPDGVAMHCLPAHVGEEITADVLYGPRCLAWEQAENRLHTQKALMALVIR